MKTYNIHFIRHGEISETLKGAYIGTKNVAVSENGKTELRRLDKFNKYPYAPVIFSSPLKRCKQTCDILYPGVTPIFIDQLMECSFGEWEGKTASQLKKYPEFEKWLAGDTSVKPPRGESGADFTRRICKIFESIVEGLMKTGTTDCAIITHGGVIMTLLAVYGLPQARPFDWAVESGCGYSLRVSPLMWQRDKVCEVYQTLPVPKDEEELEEEGL